MADRNSVVALRGDFSKIQTMLKREHLLIQDSISAIRDAVTRLKTESEELRLLSWNTILLCRKVDMLMVGRIKVNESWLEFDADAVTKLAAPYNKLGMRMGATERLLSLVWDRPSLIAEPIARGVRINADLDDVVHAILFNLYGNYFSPREEHAVLNILDHYVTYNVGQKDDTSWLRDNSLFPRLFSAYAKNYTSGRMYLRSALMRPVLDMLESDGLNLEIDPVKVFNAFVPEERRMLGLIEIGQATTAGELLEIPALKAHLEAIYEKIILKCQAFVVSLTDHLALMPFGIRWIARQLYNAALRKGMSVQDATGMLGDLLLMRFISPAILYPEPYGIVLDTPISNTARRNLTLIAKVLRLVGRSVSVSQREPFMIPLHERLNTVALDQFYAQVINCPDLKRGLPFLDGVDNHTGRNIELLMSLKSINIIHELVRQREGLDENAQRILERVKGGFESADGEVFLVNISDDQGGFQLSSEADVLKGVPATTPGGAAATGTPSPVAELKRQLRFVLASHELVRTWQYTSLDEVISALMTTSSFAEARTTPAQLGELLRMLKEAPEEYKRDSFSLLAHELLVDYRSRAPYVSYLVKVHQDLLMTLEQLRSSREQVSNTRFLCQSYHRTMQVHTFLEKREPMIVKFVEQFTANELLDEKAALAAQFLAQTDRAMRSDKLWETTTQQELDVVSALVEKYFMCRIYVSAFNPNGTIDLGRDEVMSKHIGELSAMITPEHPSLQVDKRFLAQAPWKLSQEELIKINAYKAPGDKLACIVNACKTTMNLITINNQQVGADDFFPILVYVIIKANPQYLLSTIQYIRCYFESRASGESSYWWAQFNIAVEFIKTMNPLSRDSKRSGSNAVQPPPPSSSSTSAPAAHAEQGGEVVENS